MVIEAVFKRKFSRPKTLFVRTVSEFRKSKAIELTVLRQGGVKWSEHRKRSTNRVSCTQNRAVPTHHRTPDAPVGIPASPWMRAKARSELGALIRLCGDGVVSNEANMGSFYTREKHPSPAHRTGLFRPTTALPTPPLAFPPRPGCGRRPEAN
jgi:hypothetical protein